MRMKFRSRGKDYTLEEVFATLGNSYGACADLFNKYFVGKDTPFLDREIYNFYGIELTELMNLYQKFVGDEDDIEKYFNYISEKLNDEESEEYHDLMILLYYEKYIRSLYANFGFGLYVLKESSDAMEEYRRLNPNMDKKTEEEVVKYLIWNHSDLRDILCLYAKNAYLTKCANVEGDMDKIRMNKDKYFYKEIIPELYRKILRCNGTIFKIDQFYEPDEKHHIDLASYIIIFTSGARIATVLSIVFIRGTNGELLPMNQCIRIEDLSYMRSVIGQIHPDIYRNLIGEGHIVDTNSEDEFTSSVKFLLNHMTGDEEITNFLYDTMKTFDIDSKMEVFETLIKDVREDFSIELNQTIGLLHMNTLDASTREILDMTKDILDRERKDPNYFTNVLISGIKSQGS